MKKGIKIISLLTIIIISAGCSHLKRVSINSPDGNIRFHVFSGSRGSDNAIAGFALRAGKQKVLLPSSLILNLKTIELKNKFKIIRIENESVTNRWINNFGERREVPDNYNQAKIFLENGEMKINLICRVYNEGAAFAYEFPEQEGKDSITIIDEKILFRFQADYNAWSAARAQAPYTRVPLSRIETGCERPLVIEFDSTLTIALAEAKLVDYARMKFEPDTTDGISIRSRLGSEVLRSLPFQSPWRVVMIGKNPGDLLEKTIFC